MDEVARDPAYREDIIPLAMHLLGPVSGTVLDLGCGEGQVLRAIPGFAIGCDVSAGLLDRARHAAPVVQCRLPVLSWLRDESVAAATCVLVLEHLADVEPFFTEAARILESGGRLVVVMNHPAYTPDGAGPVVDLSDGEVLWRWGAYFATGFGTEPAGEGAEVVFHHRPLGAIVNAAASSGLVLERLEERGLGPAAVARSATLVGQEHFPRLLGARWRKPARPNIG